MGEDGAGLGSPSVSPEGQLVIDEGGENRKERLVINEGGTNLDSITWT